MERRKDEDYTAKDGKGAETKQTREEKGIADKEKKQKVADSGCESGGATIPPVSTPKTRITRPSFSRALEK